MSWPLSVLHLSDLHFGPHGRFADQDIKSLAERFHQAIEQARQELGWKEPVSLCITTGDIAETARPNEYAQALEFFEALTGALGLSRQRVIFTPGNHDVSWNLTRRVELDQNDEGFNDLELERRIQEVKLNHFEKHFIQAFYGKERSQLPHVKSIGHGAFVHSFPDERFAVAALNSCELESHRRQAGFLSDKQAQALMSQWHRKDALPWIRLIAVHHNPVATVPENVHDWVDHLKKQGTANKPERFDHFAADAVGFEGREHLRSVCEDCQVQLILHGHHHAEDRQSWPWKKSQGHTLVLSSGSWGLRPDKLPGAQPNMMHLVRIDPAEKRVHSVLRIYEPRARSKGHVVPGDFTADPSNTKGTPLDLTLPPGFQDEETSSKPRNAAIPTTANDIAEEHQPKRKKRNSRRATGETGIDQVEGKKKPVDDPAKRKSTALAKTKKHAQTTGDNEVIPTMERVPQYLTIQDELRKLLEVTLSPWRIIRWEQSDFGIDAVVETAGITPGTDTPKATGRLFSIQMQANYDSVQPTSLNIATTRLRYWLNHSLPVLLISAHLPTRTMRARWIDNALLTELRSQCPALWAQATIMVALTEMVSASSRSSLEDAVRRFRRRELVTPPSRFFELRNQVLQIADELERAGRTSGVKSVELLVNQTRTTLRASAYTVAIAGPQRAGKSTLVNAILGVEVSPVADYPTTAVPLIFDAGDPASAHVFFENGSQERVEVSAEALRPFAAQQENDANDKGVRVIRVVFPNDMLARGVSLIDTPGLHDASPAVRQVTQAALHDADAVLYVLDAAAGPKFKLGQAEIEDLQNLQTSKDRVLIILNQADDLEHNKRQPLFDYVERQLKKYDLWCGLPTHPIFVSGKEAWKARMRGSSPSAEFHRLEDELWGHLLRTRATGLHRLTTALTRLREACESASAMLSNRAEKGAEAGQLDRARRTCTRAIAQASALEQQWRTQTNASIKQFLSTNVTRRAAELSTKLSSIPTQGQLPTADAIQKQLQSEVLEDSRAVWSFIQQQIKTLALEQNKLIQAALEDSSAQLGIPLHIDIAVPHLSALIAPDVSLPEAQLGFLSGLLGFLINPVFGLATTLFGWFVGHDVAITRRRKRVIKELSARHQEYLQNAYTQLARQVNDRIAAASRALTDQTRGRLETFIADAERRIARLGAPMQPSEAARLRSVAVEVKQLHEKIDVIAKELTPLVSDY